MGVSAASSPRARILIHQAYQRLFSAFGPQHWWPARTPFEVMVGAILVQNTNWKNVEKAIDNLRNKKLLSPRKLNAVSLQELAKYIRPAGYFNVKAKRIKNFVTFFIGRYQGSLAKMRARSVRVLREQLLSVSGVGQETADSILLYALSKPIFVIDAYTKRVFSRHKIFSCDISYQDAQEIFHKNLPQSGKIYNEYHALIVQLAKQYCRVKPLCLKCPLNRINQHSRR